MYCKNKIVHTIKEGDSLYKLAKQYMTTVTELILENPGVNPYNLQVGMRFNICPGPGYAVPEEKEDSLSEEMMRVWLEHVYWHRMLMLSMPMEETPQMQMSNEQATKERLLRNVGEIVNTFQGYLSKTELNQLRDLLMEHEDIAAEMMKLLMAKDMDAYQREVNAWYENAAKMASLLAKNMKPGSETELRRMLFEHLDLLRQEMEQYYDGEYKKSIETFDIAAEQAESLAKFIASRLV